MLVLIYSIDYNGRVHGNIQAFDLQRLSVSVLGQLCGMAHANVLISLCSWIRLLRNF